ncbi:N-acetylglucosamine kinase [Plantactinospora sp. KBS50]|uniref:N-acetylglucosamine kinase n=1 Tax=Plantactinospora sp. KBS50 TaxID=2024580 RepID=UPI000BAAF9BB|nr:BadF/BadG/BcrA/BcrD ATPase family protein [Plantactinospora sp. KBS50]ASW55844.1 ATPase [Plantactinospora sp. KBS50]
MAQELVLGMDIGGSTTRAEVVTTDGERRGTGRAGGGNPTSHGAPAAAAELGSALRHALRDVDPGTVRAGLIGLAGVGRLLADAQGRAAFDRAWRDAGLRCGYELHGDALVAYASGTADPDGTVLIAGTGAIAAQFRDLRQGHTADGHGWLLGDAGSGFWLGREAVRHTLAALDAETEPSALGRAVLTELLGDAVVETPPRRTVSRLVQAVTRRSPVDLARLAPLVLGHAEGAAEVGEGAAPIVTVDEGAARIVAAAAARLTATVARIRPAGQVHPVVLAGGLLGVDNPLTRAVRAALAERWPAAPLLPARDGALAAAWLAARGLDPDRDRAAALHARLLGG